jgi:hypothetical protein
MRNSITVYLNDEQYEMISRHQLTLKDNGEDRSLSLIARELLVKSMLREEQYD